MHQAVQTTLLDKEMCEGENAMEENEREQKRNHLGT